MKMKFFPDLNIFIGTIWASMIFPSKVLQFALISIVVMFVFILQWLLNLNPALLEKMYEITYNISPMKDTNYPIKDFVNLYTTGNFPMTVIKLLYTELFTRTAREGRKAPNLGLISLEGQTEHKILGLCKKGRPLVLTFGSCT